MSEPVVITGDKITGFHMLQLMHGLAFEIRTGMKMSNRGSLVTMARNTYGIKSRKKYDALMELRALFTERYGYEPNIGASL